MRLLLVEDNSELSATLPAQLGTAGFSVDCVETVADARLSLSAAHYAAVILDLGLPDDDGLNLLGEIRRRSDPIPVLILTARSGVADRVSGLRGGADDYLVKPFAYDELVARLEALLRRPNQFIGRTLQFANIALDTQSRQVFVNGAPEVLSSREITVLELLMFRKGQVVPKKIVEDHLYGLSGEVSSNAVEVYVHRLRKQLSDHGAKVRIHTVRGVGYLLTEEKET